MRNYYINNKDDILSKNKTYYEQNKETIIKNRVQYKRNRYNNDQIFRETMKTHSLNYYHTNKLLLQEQKHFYKFSFNNGCKNYI